MRGDAMSGTGSPNARAPNLDRLATQGVLFNRCFSNNPVCVPSRKSIFSGRFPSEHGSLANSGGHHLTIEGTLAGAMRARGYRTGFVGKNHTFEKPEMNKFDFSSVRDREPFRAYNQYVRPNWHMDSMWPQEKCYGSVNTEGALVFLNQANSRDPFFLTVSDFDPHPPYMAPATFTSRYASRDMKLPATVHPGEVSTRLQSQAEAMEFDKQTDADLTETMRYYYAAIDYGVDHQVGRLMRALDEKGLAQSTLVIFTSDHGDFMATIAWSARACCSTTICFTCRSSPGIRQWPRAGGGSMTSCNWWICSRPSPKSPAPSRNRTCADNRCCPSSPAGDGREKRTHRPATDR
jgi:arylsulfatase A-like enzyme